jgi:catechol 2,3-dioxygenase-like lactoylglutathione lyase family enzyme
MESLAMNRGLPGFSHVDHIGLTVPELDKAAKFYCEVLGGHELYRLGPFDAAECRARLMAETGPKRISTSLERG